MANRLGGGGIAALTAPRHSRLVGALALGLAVRTLIAHDLGSHTLTDDPRSYAELAKNLRFGRGLIVSNSTYGPVLQAAFPPLYPLLLAAFPGPLLLNSLIDVGAAFCIRRLSGSDLLAAIYFLFPSVILASVIPSKEGLAILILLLTMLAFDRSAILFGLLVGLLALTQPAWLPVPAIALLWSRPGLRPLVLAATSAVLVMLPWWVRNYLLFSHFVPLTTSGGLSLAVAFNGTHVPTIGMPGDEVARSATVFAKTLAQIADAPGHYVGNCVRQLVRAFLTDDDAVDYLQFASPSWLGAAALIGQLSFAALVACARRPDARFMPFVVGFAVNCLLFGGMWLEFSSRHRAFLIPLLLVSLSQLRRRPLPPASDGDRESVLLG